MLLAPLLLAAKLFSMNSNPVADKMDIRVEETKRTRDTSTLRIEVVKLGASVGSSMFIYGAMLRLATQRRFPWFRKTSERDLGPDVYEMELRFYREKPDAPDVIDVRGACNVLRCK